MKRTLALLVIALHAPFAAAVYKCVDDKGHTLFGDTPPPGCGNVPIYEVTPSGNVIRRIDPTPTAQQIEIRREERERLRKEQAIAAEQKRKDMALLNTYDSADEFDVARDRNIEPVNGRIVAAQERLKELDVRERQIDDQMKSYAAAAKDGEETRAPGWIVANLEQVRSEKKTLDSAIVHYRKEIEDLRVRYETDKKRWLALKAAGGSLPPPPDAAAPAEAQPVKSSAPAHRRLGS
jgi:hypothetical protein